ncbi:MAG: hypothetical protein CMK59_08495 [Proteobacteria bacterium]|nr:hypothetical protein [Pseudomonadota bacterium]
MSKSKKSLFIFFSVGLILLAWNLWLHHDLTNMICSIDADKWSRATEEIAAQRYALATESDRLPFLPFLAQLGLWAGHSTIDALQLVSRMSWIFSIAILVAGFFHRYGPIPSAACAFALIFAQSYAQLTLEINAQILLNAEFAALLILGPILSRSSSPFAWILLGALAALTTVTKEQGFLLFPLVMLAFIIQNWSSRWLGLLGRFGAFWVGALPILAWLYSWLLSMWYRGLKFEQLRSDLNDLLKAESWSEAVNQNLYWGRINITYHQPTSYWDSLLNAWPRLTHDTGNHFLLSLGCFGIALGWLLYRRWKKLEFCMYGAELLWCVVMIIPMLPLFAMLLIEPYHLSFLQIPAMGLLAWSTAQLTKYTEGKWIFIALLPVFATLVFLTSRYQHIHNAVAGNLGACAAGRILPVDRWVERRFGKEHPVIYTDPMIRFDRLRPDSHSWITESQDMPKPCQTQALIATSEWTNGYDNIAPYLGGWQWKLAASIRSINQEIWEVYTPYCPK